MKKYLQHLFVFLLCFPVFLQAQVNWQKVTGPNHYVRSIASNSADAWFASVATYGVRFSSDNGNSWSDLSTGLPDSNTSLLAVSTIDEVFVVTGSNGVYQYTGGNWVDANAGLPLGINVTALTKGPAGKMYLAGSTGSVFVWTGATWTDITYNLVSPAISSLCFSSAGVLYAGDNGAGVFKFDGVSSWSAFGTGMINTNVKTICVTSEDSVFAACNNTVYKIAASGGSWVDCSAGLLGNSINAMSIGAQDQLYIATASRAIFYLGKHVGVWSYRSSINTPSILSLGINSTGTVIAGASGVYRSMDAGQSWGDINTYFDARKPCFYFAASKTGVLYFGTQSDGIYRSMNHGLTWDMVNFGLSKFFTTSISVDAAGNVFYAANNGVTSDLYRSADNGNTWTLVRTGSQTYNRIIQHNSDTLWLCQGLQNPTNLAFSVDGGNNWTDDPRLLCGQAYDMTFVPNGTRYVGCGTGTLARSANSGNTWSQNVSGSNTWGPVLTVERDQAGYIFASSTNGGGGIYFATPASNGTFFSSFSNFPTTTGGVNDIIFDKSNNAYVASNNGVYTAPNSSWTFNTSWNVLNSGMTATTQCVNLGIDDQGYLYTSGSNTNGGLYRSTARVNNTSADLGVQKFVSPAPYCKGQSITYRIYTSNTGTDNAANVVVKDVLSPNLSLVSSTVTSGSYNVGTGNWNIDNINPGRKDTLTIVATILAGGNIINSAKISSTTPDPVSSNDSSGVSINANASSDLAVTLSVTAGPYYNGQIIPFTIDIKNNGPDAAGTVNITDKLPTGFVFVSASPSTGTYNPNTGIWAVGTLANGGSELLTLNAKLNGTGTYTNTASVFNINCDNNTLNNISSKSVNPQPSADLKVLKTVSAGPYSTGQKITYTVSAINQGPNNATGVSVIDFLPSQLTFISATPSFGTYDLPSGTWTIGNLNKNATYTLIFDVAIKDTGLIVNNASISGTLKDLDLTNNSTTTFTRVGITDLRIVKTVAPGNYFLGDVITYTIDVSNLSADKATGVYANDLLPPSLSFVSAVSSAGTYDQTTGLWYFGFLDPGTSQSLTIQATINSPGDITNTASISGNEFDPNMINDTSRVTIHAVNSTLNPDLKVTKTVSIGPYNKNQNVVFTINAKNNGVDDATGIIVKDLLPAGLTFVSAAPSSGTYNSSNGYWTIGSLVNGQSQTLDITAKPTVTGNIINKATIAGFENDPDHSNDSSSISIYVTEYSDLNLIKGVLTSGPYYVGQKVSYSITAGNIGPDNATNVQVSDVLPAQLSYFSSQANIGSYNSATGIWTLGNVTNGSLYSLTITATINNTGPIINSASISGFQLDTVTTNNNGQVTINAQLPPKTNDLEVVKTVSAGPYHIGQNITYTVSISNLSGDDATGVYVTDLLPSGLTLVSYNASVGTYNSTNGSWNIAGLASGVSHMLKIVATIKKTGDITNSATITENEIDAVQSNNTSTVTITALPPSKTTDLRISKTVSGGPYVIGKQITYNIIVLNTGPDNASGVVVTDILPSGVVYVSCTPSTGTYTATNGIWSIGNMNSGTSSTLNIVTSIKDSGFVVNSASVTGNETDGNLNNNTSSVSIKVADPKVDLKVLKSVSSGPYYIDQNVTYNIVVGNLGSYNATGVKVTDLLPSGVIYVSSIPSIGSYNSGTGIWTVGNLNNGSTESLAITAKIKGTGTIVNGATVTGNEKDTIQSNNTAQVSIKVATADLKVTKTVSPGPYSLGQIITYTIIAQNIGPDSALNVKVFDLLPRQLTLKTATQKKGTYSINGNWAIVKMQKNETDTLKITARIDSTGEIINSAVISAKEFDPDSANNSSIVLIEVEGTSGLSQLNKSSIKLYPNPASNILFVDFNGYNQQELIVRDITGKEIMQMQVKGEKSIQISLEKFRMGEYFIILKDVEGKVNINKLSIIK